MLRRVARTVRDFGKTFWALMKEARVFRYSTLISMVFIVAQALLPLWRLGPLLENGDYIPLHYNVYFGVDGFGPWYYVFVPAALGLSLFVINLIFETVFFRKEHVISYFFAAMTVFTELVLLAAVVFIVLLNI